MADSHCRYCDRDIEGGGSVRLWDGRDYCEECVENTSPGFAEYARTHPILSESPHRGTPLRLVVLTLLGGGLLSLALGLDGPRAMWPLALGMGFGVAFLVAFVSWAITVAIGFGNVEPTVTVQNGVIVAEHWPYRTPKGPRWPRSERTYSLADCKYWSEPTALFFSIDVLRRRRRFWRRIIMLKFPRRATYCGRSPETRERLVAFLTLAGIPKRGS